MKALFGLLALIMVAACGGNGGSGQATIMQPPPEAPQPEPAPTTKRLPFPYSPSGHYRVDGLPEPQAADASHMPIYRDDERLYVGVDQGSSFFDTFTIEGTIGRIEHDLAGSLPVVGARGDTEIRHASIPDGIGAATLRAYLADAFEHGLSKVDMPHEVRVVGQAHGWEVRRLYAAVQIVNASLPAGFKMTISDPIAEPDYSDGIVNVQFVEQADYPRNTAAFTSGRISGVAGVDGGVYENAHIVLNRGANANTPAFERWGTILLAHELIHAHGPAHVSRDFDTIMEGTSDIHATEQGVPQPLSLLYPVDREALQALYGRLEVGGSPTDFGPWAATTMRIDGNGSNANFGVASRNGYAEPWAYGPVPDMDLADNQELSETATWIGTLLGFTPQAETVAGDAEIGVNLGTMAGTADFTGLENWATGVAPGDAGSGAQWLDGDLGYAISVNGNTFRETGGDAGRLTGIFTGASHEGAAGTLERSDLTAAFGASR